MRAYLTFEEVERMAQAATNLRDKLLIYLLFWSGCRVSEALGIRVEDVNPGKGTVTIQHLKTRIKLLCPFCDTRLSRAAKFCPGCGQGIPTPIKKEQDVHRIRTIPLEKRTMERLVDFIRRDETQGLIFKIGRSQAQKTVRACAIRAGVEDLVDPKTGKVRGVSPHRLRDAFAVMAVQHDDSTDAIRMLQEHLGHQSITTTMEYRKLSGEELVEWYQNLKS